jgi:hypothetical protein
MLGDLVLGAGVLLGEEALRLPAAATLLEPDAGSVDETIELDSPLRSPLAWLAAPATDVASDTQPGASAAPSPGAERGDVGQTIGLDEGAPIPAADGAAPFPIAPAQPGPRPVRPPPGAPYGVEPAPAIATARSDETLDLEDVSLTALVRARAAAGPPAPPALVWSDRAQAPPPTSAVPSGAPPAEPARPAHLDAVPPSAGLIDPSSLTDGDGENADAAEADLPAPDEPLDGEWIHASEPEPAPARPQPSVLGGDELRLAMSRAGASEEDIRAALEALSPPRPPPEEDV